MGFAVMNSFIKNKTKFIYTKFTAKNRIYLIQFRGLNWLSFEKTVFPIGLLNLGIYFFLGSSSTISLIMGVTLILMSKIMEEQARKNGGCFSLDRHLSQYKAGDILHVDQLGHFLISSKHHYGDGYQIEAHHLEHDNAPVYVIISGMKNFTKDLKNFL